MVSPSLPSVGCEACISTSQIDSVTTISCIGDVVSTGSGEHVDRVITGSSGYLNNLASVGIVHVDSVST